MNVQSVVVRFDELAGDAAARVAMEEGIAAVLRGGSLGAIAAPDDLSVAANELVLRGPDANAIYDAIRPLLLLSLAVRQVSVALRYGEAGDGIDDFLTTLRPAPLPFPIEACASRSVESRLRELRSSGKGIPVILGDVRSILEWQEWLATAPWPPVEAVLEDAAAIDVAAWLELREAEELALDAVIPDEQAALAAWPRDQAPLGCLGETRRHAPEQPLWIGKLATSDPWAVAACLQIGGWNDCPATPVHVALWHSWEERFGARIACATGSTVEFTVDRPPRVREEALRLAREHFLYCPDQIDQGYGTFERLAAALLDAPVWRFWWD